ncbi:MAG: M56 family metallopeptidase [Candidatus Shapirobacteria bacterium]|jgi:hypothetical protein
MNYKRLNLISNVYFFLILFSGLLYTALLITASQKIVPALIMQIIFFLDAIKFDNNVVGLITSRLFLLNVVPGIFLIGLMVRFGKTLIKSLKSISSNHLLFKGLEIIESTEQFFKFKSDDGLVFTCGFLKPKIFVSSGLFKTHSQEEITAIVQHEVNHKNNLHPFKIFTANFVKSILPIIPLKNWLIDNYLTLVEVSSDLFSENKINNKLPLVSALLKFQNRNFEPAAAGVSYFNSQSERIKILVGQKKQFIKIPMAYYSLVLVVMLSGVLMVKNSNIFFDCQHLLKCVEILMTSNNQPLLSVVSPQNNTFSPSDHCQ